MECIENKDITVKVKFITPTDVKIFVWVTSESKGEVDCIENNRNCNGKSILGIFSLNLSEPIDVIFHDCYGNESFFEKLKEWEVKD
jgi:hypothetical protein